MAVVTKSCERCGDQLVIQTHVRGGTALVTIEQFPVSLADVETGEPFDIADGDQIKMLYGLVAVPVSIAERAWVVTQYTELNELAGHRLHRVHVCPGDVSQPRPAQQVGDVVERANVLLGGFPRELVA